ncbi:hypothetical protein NC651_004641 [Populus alba x Populus x berolinensis]|nr:hypothetical protein NC651_004641 [Populus alba x Populus x berolinensis]
METSVAVRPGGRRNGIGSMDVVVLVATIEDTKGEQTLLMGKETLLHRVRDGVWLGLCGLSGGRFKMRRNGGTMMASLVRGEGELVRGLLLREGEGEKVLVCLAGEQGMRVGWWRLEEWGFR